MEVSGVPHSSRAWHLVSRPHGWPQAKDVELVESSVGEPAEGSILVRNSYFSVEPYMRGRMNEGPSYAPGYALGEPMTGTAVGEIVASRAPGLGVGDYVVHDLGWREYSEVPAGSTRAITPTPDLPLSAHLSILGIPGLAAYAGVTRTAGLRVGDVFYVSDAAGPVGSMAGQVARIRGASRVIGSAGSEEKVRILLEEYGFDAAFNYKNGPVGRQLAAAAPDGIDVYFDNVGGEHLEAALDCLRLHGRVVICGMISGVNGTEPPAGPRNLRQVINKRLRVEGMLILDHQDLAGKLAADVSSWVAAGKLSYRETVIDGIENGFDAFLSMMRGENSGKTNVRLAE